MTAEQMRGLADIAERFGSGTIRLTVWQNLLISDVADRDVGVVHRGHRRRSASASRRAPIRARPRRLHRQCRLQVRRLQHQGPRAEARRLSRGARRRRPADQHPPHRLPPLLRPALHRRHRPARRQGRARRGRASRAITSMSAAAPRRPTSRRWRASIAPVGRVRRAAAAARAPAARPIWRIASAPSETLLRVLPPPRDRRRCASWPSAHAAAGRSRHERHRAACPAHPRDRAVLARAARLAERLLRRPISASTARSARRRAAAARRAGADEDFPWHDAALAMAERLELAEDASRERQLMAAMAQLDCGQCGYLCQTYAEAVWSRRRGRPRPLRAGRQGDRSAS